MVSREPTWKIETHIGYKYMDGGQYAILTLTQRKISLHRHGEEWTDSGRGCQTQLLGTMHGEVKLQKGLIIIPLSSLGDLSETCTARPVWPSA